MHSQVITDIDALMSNDPDYDLGTAAILYLRITFADGTTEDWDCARAAFDSLLDISRRIQPKSNIQ